MLFAVMGTRSCIEVLNHYIVCQKLILQYILSNQNLNKNLVYA